MLPDPALKEDGSDLPISDLNKDVPFDPNIAPSTGAVPIDTTPASRLQEARATVEEEHASQSKQNTLWRRVLFWGVSSIVALFVIMEGVAIVIYVATTPHLDPIVMSTWFAASAVQIIGLLVVITRHLFPGDNPSK